MLSLDAQRRLTEFLGECWHEQKRFSPGNYSPCRKCGSEDESQDFSDWRVVGRLVERVEYLTIGRNDTTWGVDLAFNANAALHYAATPQEAICLAIDAYLVEKGEGK